MSLSLPNTWKQCTDAQLNAIYDEVYGEAVRLGLLSEIANKRPLYIHKSVRNWGICHWKRISNGSFDSAICINDKILLAKKYDVARKVIVHEIAHMAEPMQHHNSVWYETGNRLGKKWNITVNRTDRYEGIDLRGEEEAKHIIECPECHNQWKYNRAGKVVKNLHRYSCPKCHCNLVKVK